MRLWNLCCSNGPFASSGSDCRSGENTWDDNHRRNDRRDRLSLTFSCGAASHTVRTWWLATNYDALSHRQYFYYDNARRGFRCVTLYRWCASSLFETQWSLDIACACDPSISKKSKIESSIRRHLPEINSRNKVQCLTFEFNDSKMIDTWWLLSRWILIVYKSLNIIGNIFIRYFKFHDSER